MPVMTQYPQFIRTVGATKLGLADATIAGREFYTCANKGIVNGEVVAKKTLEECIESDAAVLAIAKSLFPELATGSDAQFIASLLALDTYVTPSTAGGMIQAPPLPYTDCTLTNVIDSCTAANGCGLTAGTGPTPPEGFLFDHESYEQYLIRQVFDSSWRGCFWIDPQAPYSNGNIDIGQNFINYLKLRLTNATFWNTPEDAPVRRQQFLASSNTVLQLNVAGDLGLRPGDIVYINFNAVTRYVTSAVGGESYITGYYYILRTLNVFTDDGRHETNIFVTNFNTPTA